MDRLVRVHFAHCLADRRRQAGRIALRLDNQGGERNRLLIGAVIVSALAAIARKIGILHATHYADDARPRRTPAPHVLADRVLVGPILARQILVDDYGRFGSLPILAPKQSPTFERNTHGFEVSWAH